VAASTQHESIVKVLCLPVNRNEHGLKKLPVHLLISPKPTLACDSLIDAGDDMAQNRSMTATLTIDDAGQINLPEALKRVFGVEPGVRLRAEVTSDRIELVRDIPVVTEGVLENGVLLLPKLGIKMNAGAAIRADRDEQAQRALSR